MGRCSRPLPARLGTCDPDPESQTAGIFGFHRPTTLLDRYLPLAPMPGHPYLVTHDSYGRTF